MKRLKTRFDVGGKTSAYREVKHAEGFVCVLHDVCGVNKFTEGGGLRPHFVLRTLL